MRLLVAVAILILPTLTAAQGAYALFRRNPSTTHPTLCIASQVTPPNTGYAMTAPDKEP